MLKEPKKYLTQSPPVLFFRWSVAFGLVLAALLFSFQSCSKSDAGGTTGGNPLDSSLPQQISADVQ